METVRFRIRRIASALDLTLRRAELFPDNETRWRAAIGNNYDLALTKKNEWRILDCITKEIICKITRSELSKDIPKVIGKYLALEKTET